MKPTREICALCHEVSRVGFWVPNEIWELVVLRGHEHSIICLSCFTKIADEKAVEWDKEIKFHPISWVTHQEHLKEMSK